MMKETVSVIIAVYNVEKYLENCLKSICTQSYLALEIILVDDGSVDSSAAICDRWAEKDMRIRVVHQDNQGVSSARNRGIDAAAGTYLAFLDADDWVEPDFVKELLKNHRQGQIAVLGYQIDFTGKRNRRLIKKYGEKITCHLQQKEIVALFQSGLFSPIWNKLYDRELIASHHIRFCEQMNLGEDIVFNLQYINCLSGEFCIVNKPLYHYMRRGTESLDHCYNEQYAEIQKKIYHDFFEFADRVSGGCSGRNQLRGLYFNALVTAMDNLYVCRRELEPSFYRKSMKERKKDPEFYRLIREMDGMMKRVYRVRYFFLSHGFYVFDFYLRNIVKRILKR